MGKKEPSKRKAYCSGDKCPTCRVSRLEFDKGHAASWTDPGDPAKVYCPSCGETLEPDFARLERRDLAKTIARLIMTDGNGRLAARLKLDYDGNEGGSGWAAMTVVDQIANLLDYHGVEPGRIHQ